VEIDDFPIPHDEDCLIVVCVVLFSTLGGCLSYSLLSHLFTR